MKPLRQDVDVVDDRRGPEPQIDQNRPQLADIAKENMEGAEEDAEA